MTRAAIPAEMLSRLCYGAATVAGKTQLKDVLWATVETAIDLTGARYGALGVVGDHGTLSEFVHVGMEPETVAAIGPPPTGRGVLGTITRMARTVRLERIRDHPDTVGFPANHPPMDSFLGVPVRTATEIYGNLYLTEKTGGFSVDDEVIVEALAVIAGSAINTAQLRDRLTRVAVVEDRARIARDLHDGIIQDLFATGLMLQALSLRVEDENDTTSLNDAVKRLDEVISSLRDFIFDLQPPTWARRALVDRVSSLVDQLSAPHDTEVTVRYAAGLEVDDPAVADHVLHLLREALSNALRHAEGTRVEVGLSLTDDTLTLTVTDDGCGFDVDNLGPGMGLRNMRSRSVDAGGHLEIESSPGTGTTVRALLQI